VLYPRNDKIYKSNKSIRLVTGEPLHERTVASEINVSRRFLVEQVPRHVAAVKNIRGASRPRKRLLVIKVLSVSIFAKDYLNQMFACTTVALHEMKTMRIPKATMITARIVAGAL
jgi:hypothetical protein